MPTPFTHLAAAQRLLASPALPQRMKERLQAELPAFLLGNIAADATRLHAPGTRQDTHFYQYDEPMRGHPWRLMLQQHPALQQPQDEAQRIFLAGYVAHLAMDEIWTQQVMWPLLQLASDPADRRRRALAMTLLMTRCDERDYGHIDAELIEALARARPASWLPFLSDADLATMRGLIVRQLRGRSETLDILSKRWGLTPQDFRATLDEPQTLQREVWAWISREQLIEVEQTMDAWMLAQVQDWLNEQVAQSSSTALTRN